MKYELFTNNSANCPNKNTFLLAILLITIIASISPLNSFAQEGYRIERAWNGRITKAELKQELLNLKENEFVVGYVINGSDIIEIIEETDLDIKIKNSVIEGGLDFTTLPATLYVPFFKEKRQVNNEISIKNSAIGFGEKKDSKISVYSENILFNKLISFRGAQFIGVADFSEAQFRRKAYFSEAQFSERANFINVQFSERASFGGAQFSNSADFRHATFDKLAFFQGAIFYNELILDLVLFQEYADFRNTVIRRINWNNTSPTIIRGRTDLREARITESHFGNLVFTQDVIFSDAEFGSPLFTRHDIDWTMFLKKFKKQLSAEGNNPSKRIWESLDKPLQALINELDFDNLNSNEMKNLLFLGANHKLVDSFIKQLNSILEQKDFYKDDLFLFVNPVFVYDIEFGKLVDSRTAGN